MLQPWEARKEAYKNNVHRKENLKTLQMADASASSIQSVCPYVPVVSFSGVTLALGSGHSTDKTRPSWSIRQPFRDSVYLARSTVDAFAAGMTIGNSSKDGSVCLLGTLDLVKSRRVGDARLRWQRRADAMRHKRLQHAPAVAEGPPSGRRWRQRRRRRLLHH